MLAASCFVGGRRLTRRLVFANGAEEVAVCTSLGLGALGSLLFLLGLAKMLYAGVAVAGLAALHLGSLSVWRETAARLLLAYRGASRRARAGWSLAVAAALAPIGALALYPPTVFDSTLYHLPYAKAFASSHSLPLLPSLRFPVFPQLGEVLFTLMLQVSGDVATHLVQLLALLLVALALAGLVGETSSHRAQAWAAAVWLGNPIAVYYAGSATVDVFLSLWSLIAVVAWERWSRSDDRRWLILSASFAGFAGATKYLGLFFVAALGLMTAWASLRRRRLAPLAVFALVAAIVAGPWYGRIASHTGNPVFPFFTGLFGESEWQTHFDAALEGNADEVSDHSVLVSLAARAGKVLTSPRDLVTLPWRVAFDRQLANRQPPVSPVYLVLLPVLVVVAAVDRRLRVWLLLAFAYVFCWLILIRDIRYLLPALAPLAWAGGAALDRALSHPFVAARLQRFGTAITVSAALLFFLPGWLYAGYKVAERGPVPVTTAQREAYLESRLPGYHALRWLDRRLAGRYVVYGLYAENLRYFAEGEFLGDWYGPASFRRVLAVADDGEALFRELDGLGVDHLLVRDGGARWRPPRDAAFERHFRKLLQTADAVLFELRE